jgi:hypothetical protein
MLREAMLGKKTEKYSQAFTRVDHHFQNIKRRTQPDFLGWAFLEIVPHFDPALPKGI